MDNVYYDNVMHICVYEGKKSLFASDVTKQMFDKVLPVDFLEQSILSDTKFMKVDRNGFHYQAVPIIPETSIYSIVNMEVSFKGDLTITSSNKKHHTFRSYSAGLKSLALILSGETDGYFSFLRYYYSFFPGNLFFCSCHPLPLLKERGLYSGASQFFGNRNFINLFPGSSQYF